MTIKDSSESRVKARAARTVMELNGGQEIFAHLHGLMNAHGLKAVTAIDLTGGPDVGKHTNAHTDEDRDVLHDFVTGLVVHALPADIQALRGALILAVRDDGVIDIATWGSNAAACDAIADWSKEIMDELPVAPFQTYFGWGNGGRPKKMPESDLKMLGEAGRAFVERYTHRRADEA